MNNINELIKNLKSDEFTEAAEESYLFLSADKEEPTVRFEEYLSALKGLFVDKFITAIDTDEMNYIMNAAKNSDIYAVDANSVFKLLETTKAKMGDVIEKDYFKQMMEITEYKYEPMYDDLSKYNNIITNIIRKSLCFHGIKQIKMGNYKAPGDYRLSQKEIRMLENVKMIGPINRIIHDLYDNEGIFWSYCEYDEIPEDSVLKRFAFHADKPNPLFKIVFEDGTIVEYIEGDPRVLSYKFNDLVALTKLNIVEDLEENNIYDINSLEIQDFVAEALLAVSRANNILSTLEDVYTKRMIETSQRELEGIKELVKEYNL